MPDTSSTVSFPPKTNATRYTWSLTIGFSAVLILFTMVTWYGLNSLKNVQQELEHIVDDNLEKIIAITTMEENARLRTNSMYKMSYLTDPFDRDDVGMDLHKYAPEFANARLRLLDMQLDQNEKRLLTKQVELTGIAIPIQLEISNLLAVDKTDLATEKLITFASPAQEKVLNVLNEISNYQANKARVALIKSKNTYESTLQNILWISGITLLIALGIISTVIVRAYKMTAERETHLNELEDVNKAYLQSVNSLQLANQREHIANETKSTFLANMSHEIRTPLTSIIGFSEDMLEHGQLTEQNLISTTTIQRSGKHLLKVINEILDISKIESGKLEIEKLDTSIFILLDDLHALLDLQAQEKGLSFEIRYHFPLPEKIHTDPTRLKQILLNLCNNAIKFTKKGGVTIDVFMNVKNNLIEFNISDTGIGIEQHKMDSIFSSFLQEDTSTTREYGGTGLGLSISKQLSEMLGGNISVTSTKGLGSIFKLAIDMGSSSEEHLVVKTPDRNHENILPDASQRSQTKLNAKILLAEDNNDNQELIKLLISKTGCELDIAGNGKKAIGKAMTEDYDMILMDMQMPVMDGVEATKLLRQSGYDKPIIALTANARTKDIKACLAAGCSEFIPKPIDKKTFYASLNKHLNRKLNTDQTNHDAMTKIMDTLSVKFISNLPTTLEKINTAIAEKDIPALKNVLHNLKGMGGSFGFPEISHCALQLENTLKTTHIENMTIEIKSLEKITEPLIAQHK